MAKYLLKDTAILNLLKESMKKFSEGYIHFENENEWRRIFFYGGKIASASSSCRSDYLGQYLMSSGLIDIKQFEKSYQSNFETKEDIDAVHNYVPPNVLKQLIHEKIINTIFLATRWPDGTYSVFNEKQIKYFDVDAELSLKDIKQGLKERIKEYRNMLKIVPELGARPDIDYKASGVEMSHQEEMILNYLVSGKTIVEILSIMPAHNYLLFKGIYRLLKAGVLLKGSGVPLSKEDITELVYNSISNKKTAVRVLNYSVDESNVEKEELETGKHKLRSEIEKYRKMHDEFPENPLYVNLYEKAKSCFIVDFYKNKLSPFAALELIGEIDKIPDISNIDAGIYYELKKNDHGKLSIRNLINSMNDRNEVDVLVSIGKLMQYEVVRESEPESFLDAIKLERNDCYEKLFKKKERNNLFKVGISDDLTPLMFSVVTSDYPEEIAEELGEGSGSDEKKVIHNYKMTLLMLAAMLGNYEAAEFLIKNNAKINKHNGNGVTPLMLALENKNNDIALLLLRKGADVNVTGKDGCSALMVAVFKELSNVIDYMIRLGVDVNHVNSKGQTALIIAIKLNNKDIVVSLIAAGTDLNLKDEEGRTPIDHADSVEVTELIRKGKRYSKHLNKERIKKKKKEIKEYKRDPVKPHKTAGTGILPIIIFILFVVITASVNAYMLFFSGDRFQLSFQADSVIEKLGIKYCSRFKECRDDVPEKVLNNCDQMGKEVIAEFFRFAQECNENQVRKCGSCLRTLKCEDFIEINVENYMEYCSDCVNVCK